MTYDKPILIQQLNEVTEEWTTRFSLHARVNKTRGGETFNGGSSRSNASRTFEIRYFKQLEDIDGNTQSFRIVYRGRTYNIVDYDDYMESHKNIKLIGEVYG